MKKNLCCTLVLAAALGLAIASPAFATDLSRYGAEIRKAQVSGYTLTYTLIGVPEMNVTSVMPMSSYDGGPNKSHHLMVFVTGANGRAVRDIDVGYVVTRPSGVSDGYPAFVMDGGAGTDVDLAFRGAYTIQTKIALPETELVDSFVYDLK
ncbi:MAG TPA: hypothetical protein VI078_06565 [bacterium]